MNLFKHRLDMLNLLLNEDRYVFWGNDMTDKAEDCWVGWDCCETYEASADLLGWHEIKERHPEILGNKLFRMLLNE